jgi:hypothetical protein
MTNWALHELHVPVPPDRHLFYQLKDELNFSTDSDLIYTYFPYRQEDCRVLDDKRKASLLHCFERNAKYRVCIAFFYEFVIVREVE